MVWTEQEHCFIFSQLCKQTVTIQTPLEINSFLGAQMILQAWYDASATY